MVGVKVNGVYYPAKISGKIEDKDWDHRESKSITVEMSYEAACEIFANGLQWSIVEKKMVPVYAEDGSYAYDENGEQILMEQVTEWDNSDFNIAGDLTDHRDGTITAKMGKLTDLEEAYEIMLGGI